MKSDEEKILELIATWHEASAAGDITRILPLMADDVVFQVVGQPPFGKEAFAASFAAGSKTHSIKSSMQTKEICVCGAMAYTRCQLSVSLTSSDGSPSKRLSGFTLTIFRKEDDGRWFLSRDANLLTPES